MKLTTIKPLVWVQLVLLLAFSACNNLTPEPEPELDPTNSSELYMLPQSPAVVNVIERNNITAGATIAITTPPSNGEITEIAKGLYKYEPNDNFANGKDVVLFSITAENGKGNTITDQITFVVTTDTTNLPCGTNLLADFITVRTHETVTVDLDLNDALCENDYDSVSTSIIEGPFIADHAELCGFHLIYAAGDQAGVDGILYRADLTKDGEVTTLYSFAIVTVIANDSLPNSCTYEAREDNFTVYSSADLADTLVYELDVLINDQLTCTDSSDVFPSPSISLETYPSYGVAWVDTNGPVNKLFYLPPPGFEGTETFIHKIDIYNQTYSVNTNVTVIANDSVSTGCYESNDDHYSVPRPTSWQDTAVYVWDVLANDFFCDSTGGANAQIEAHTNYQYGAAWVYQPNSFANPMLYYAPYPGNGDASDQVSLEITINGSTYYSEVYINLYANDSSGGGDDSTCMINAYDDVFAYWVGSDSVNTGDSIPPDDSVAMVDFYLDVLGNDQLCGNYSVTLSEAPSMGSAAFISGSNTLYYRRPEGYTGYVTLKYTVSNQLTGESSQAQVYLNFY